MSTEQEIVEELKKRLAWLESQLKERASYSLPSESHTLARFDGAITELRHVIEFIEKRTAIRSLPVPSEPSGDGGEDEELIAYLEHNGNYPKRNSRLIQAAKRIATLRTALRELAEALKNLTAASRPFVDRGTVDETAGTVPLMNTLEAAIELAQQALATLKGRSKFVSESKQANGITAKSTIWPDDETMEIFRSLAARIALKDAHIAGLNEEIKIQAARIAELEAQNAEREADVRCPGCGRSMQFCDCDPNVYRVTRTLDHRTEE